MAAKSKKNAIFLQTLETRERRLQALLVDVAQFIDESKQIQERIELRWAGGWVRDRLLGIPSQDIDTTINCMTGLAFCEQMKKYVDIPKNLEKHSIQKQDLGTLHTIQANPEKSKHLETTTVKIFGFDVDFVNLRQETYTSDSRNPQMEFGSAKQDAERRDATINALFYNLHSKEVEDFCGGLTDLDAKIIRTPLDPLTTFTDDPLRVLRLIRFASRLQFKIDPATEASMSDPAVNDALKVKISRERVGVELEKMLKGQHPREALHLIDRLGLFPIIFTDPTNISTTTPALENWKLVYDCLQTLEHNETPNIYKTFVNSEDARYVTWILAALTPWSSVPLPESKAGSKLPLPHASVVGREGIKLNNKTSDIVTASFRNYGEITALRDAIVRKDAYVTERGTLGMMIRRWDFVGKNWRLGVMLAIFVEVLRAGKTDFTQILSSWQTFIDHLDGLGSLMNAPGLRPKVDGGQLLKALGIKKAGPWVKPALDVCMEWQLSNPRADDMSGAIEEVKSRREELQIPEAL